MFFKPLHIRLVLLGMIFVSGLVSAYDNVLSYVTMDGLRLVEQNPIANWIIDGYGVYGLIFAKSYGTMFAVLWMLRLVYSRYRVAIVPVFLFQVALFCYLTFATPSGFWMDDLFHPIELVFEFYEKLR